VANKKEERCKYLKGKREKEAAAHTHTHTTGFPLPSLLLVGMAMYGRRARAQQQQQQRRETLWPFNHLSLSLSFLSAAIRPIDTAIRVARSVGGATGHKKRGTSSSWSLPRRWGLADGDTRERTRPLDADCSSPSSSGWPAPNKFNWKDPSETRDKEKARGKERSPSMDYRTRLRASASGEWRKATGGQKGKDEGARRDPSKERKLAEPDF